MNPHGAIHCLGVGWRGDIASSKVLSVTRGPFGSLYDVYVSFCIRLYCRVFPILITSIVAKLGEPTRKGAIAGRDHVRRRRREVADLLRKSTSLFLNVKCNKQSVNEARQRAIIFMLVIHRKRSLPTLYDSQIA